MSNPSGAAEAAGIGPGAPSPAWHHRWLPGCCGTAATVAQGEDVSPRHGGTKDVLGVSTSQGPVNRAALWGDRGPEGGAGELQG